MLLVVDVGNTIPFSGDIIRKRVVMSFRVRTDKARTSDEYGVVIKELLMHEHALSRSGGGYYIICCA